MDAPIASVELEEIPPSFETNIVKPEVEAGSFLSRLRRNPHTGLAIVTFGLYVDYVLALVCVPILPVYATQLDIGKIGTGAIMSGRPIGTILCNPIMGWASESKVAQACPNNPTNIGYFLPNLSEEYIYILSFNFPMLLIARILQGVASSANITAGMALIADLFPSETRGKKISIALMGLSFGVLSGAPFGGIMFHFGGIRLPFLICAILIFIDGLARTFLLEEPKRSVDSSSKSEIPVWRAFWNLLKDEQIILVSGAIFFGNMGISAVELVTPLYGASILHFNSSVIGLIYLILTAAYTIAVPILAHFFGKNFGRWKTIMFGVGLMGVSISVLLLIPPIWYYIIILAIIGVGMAGVDGSSSPEMADIAERRHPDCYGKVYAISSTANALGLIVGPFIGGTLSERFGFETSLIAVGIAICCFTPVVLIVGISQRRERMSRNLSSQKLVEDVGLAEEGGELSELES